MGSSTASNQKKTIATKGSPHVAKTKEPNDVCFNPADPKQKAPFPNSVPTTRLTRGTANTKIAGKSIVVKGSFIGPPSDDEHPPFTMGDKTKLPYRLEARPTDWSRDVSAEGRGVVRFQDPTTQNRTNTTGFVDDSTLGQGGTTEEDFLKLKCTIKKLTGTCSHDGRTLGFPAPGGQGDPYYLEVLSGDTIQFAAERFDITKEPNAAEPWCREGSKHTGWKAKRTGGGKPEVTKVDTGPKFEVGTSLTNISWFDESKLGGADGGGKAPLAKGQKVQLSTSTAKSFAQLIMLWGVRNDPPQIKVEALGCAGPKTAQLKIYPAQKYSAQLLGSEKKTEASALKFYETVSKIRAIGSVAQKVFNYAGGKLEINILGETPSLDFELEYVEIKKQGGYRGVLYTPARVNKKWKVSFGFNPLIGGELKMPVPLMTFLPGLGPAASKLINAINRRYPTFKADLVVGFKVTLVLQGCVGFDEYDAPSNTGVEGRPTIEFTMELRLGLFGVEISFRFTLTVGFIIGLVAPREPKYLLALKYEGELKTKFNIILFPDKWYEIEACKAEPEFLSYKTDTAKFANLIPMS